MPSNHLILCHPLLLLPSIFPSIIDHGSVSFTTDFYTMTQHEDPPLWPVAHIPSIAHSVLPCRDTPQCLGHRLLARSHLCCSGRGGTQESGRSQEHTGHTAAPWSWACICAQGKEAKVFITFVHTVLKPTCTAAEKLLIRSQFRDFPGGLVVKTSPSNEGDTGLIPSRGTKIPHATKQLSLLTTTTEPQLGSLCTIRKDPAWCNEDTVCCNWDPMQINK